MLHGKSRAVLAEANSLQPFAQVVHDLYSDPARYGLASKRQRSERGIFLRKQTV